MFQSFAHRMARDFDRVLYWRPWVNSFSHPNDRHMGSGYQDITRVDSWLEHIDEVDVWAFPDIGYAPEQAYLRSLGKNVWGSGHGEELELLRGETKELLEEIRLPVQPWEWITGMKALREFIKKNPGWHVKVSTVRGLTESFRAIDYDLVKPKLDSIEHELGGRAEIQEFIVEEGIEGIECYDKETEVLTKDGWIKISEATLSHEVATLNRETLELEYQRPTKTIKRISKTIFKAKKQKVDMAITGGHNLAVTNYRNDVWHGGKLKLIPLQELSPGIQYQMKADAVWGGTEEKIFTLPSVDCDGGKRKGSYRIEASEIKMDDWLEFLGWMFSDGCITRLAYGVYITQSFNHPKERAAIELLLNRLPFKWNANGQSFRINNFQLYSFLRPFCNHSQKRIPPFIFGLSPRQIRIFLDALFEGDGTTATNGKTKIYCLGDDKELADDVQRLVFLAGSNGAVIKKKPQLTASFIQGRKITRTKETYDVSEHSSRFYCIKKSDFKEEEYNDYVYCVTVPNGIIYTRRNGRAVWCGNCGYDGYFVGDFPKIAQVGIEVKDQGFLCSLLPYARIPKEVREVNDKLKPVLQKYGYAGNFSTEVRISKGKGYCIDFTCRSASPAGETMQELFLNFGEIVEDGSRGELVEPVIKDRFAAQAILTSSFADENWLPIEIPKEIRNQVKLYHSCMVGDQEFIIPGEYDMAEIGSVVATGRSIDDAIKKVGEYAEQVKAFGLKCRTDVLEGAKADLLKTI